MVAATACTGEDLNRGGLAAEENDARVGQKLLDRDGSFHAVEVGHEDVGEDDLGDYAAGGLDGFLATVRSLGDEPAAIEDLHDGIRDECFVVDDEDAREMRIKLGGAVCIRHGIVGALERVAGEKSGLHGALC